MSLAFSNAGMIALLDVLHNDKGVGLDAEGLFDKALQWDASNPAAHRGLGWVYWQDGATVAAGQEWRKGGVTAQDFIPSGSWAWSQGGAEEALAWYERAMAVQPEAGDAYYYAARLHEAEHNWDEAVSLYAEALSKTVFARPELQDKARDHLQGMAEKRCFRAARTVEEAQEILEWCGRAMEKEPEVGDAYYYAARAWWFLGEKEKALDLLSQAVARPAFTDSETEIRAHLARADVLRALGRFEEAVPEYEWVIAHDSDQYWAYMGLGISWWQGYRDSDRAEDALRQAAALRPAWKHAYHWLGGIYVATDRHDEALDAYLKVLEIDPEDEWAKEQVAALQEESR